MGVGVGVWLCMYIRINSYCLLYVWQKTILKVLTVCYVYGRKLY